MSSLDSADAQAGSDTSGVVSAKPNRTSQVQGLVASNFRAPILKIKVAPALRVVLKEKELRTRIPLRAIAFLDRA
jgi:hypothetical protein